MDLNTLMIDRLLRQYDRLIHKTLSRMNMSQNHRDYDDFAQELRLKLIDLHKDLTTTPRNVNTRTIIKSFLTTTHRKPPSRTIGSHPAIPF